MGRRRGADRALAANQPLAAAIDRARPYAMLTGVHVLVDRTTVLFAGN